MAAESPFRSKDPKLRRDLEAIDQFVIVGPFTQNFLSITDSGLWEPHRNCRVLSLWMSLKTASSSGTTTVEVYKRLSGVDTLITTFNLTSGQTRTDTLKVDVALKAGGADAIWVQTTAIGVDAKGLTVQGRAK